MKSTSAGVVSGCLVWFIVFSVASSCLIPVLAAVGGFTSGTDFAVRIIGRFECPQGTTPRIHTFATTSTDDYGVEQPATGYELQCVDTGGTVVKTDPIAFAFIWIGVGSAIGLILAALLAFVLAAPAGVLLGRLFRRGGLGEAGPVEPGRS